MILNVLGNKFLKILIFYFFNVLDKIVWFVYVIDCVIIFYDLL